MFLDRIGVRRRIDLDVRCAAAVKFGEQRLEPVLLLVVDTNGLRHDLPRLSTSFLTDRGRFCRSQLDNANKMTEARQVRVVRAVNYLRRTISITNCTSVNTAPLATANPFARCRLCSCWLTRFSIMAMRPEFPSP